MTQITTVGLSQSDIVASSMDRQAIINGNFDIWQRGTSLASLTDITTTYLADRWFIYGVKDGGTPPTIAQSRQAITPGDIDGTMFFYRVSPNGAGSSFGNDMRYNFIQRIEYGTRALCGADRKVTLKFKARSSITNKRIGVWFTQYYGTGGSPSTYEEIAGTNWELTSSWADYEVTIDTNTLSGKTFGTNYNDWFSVNFAFAWGSTYNSYVDADSAEDWGGSGNIDIAQVQLGVGDVALPFDPKSYADELAACQRYFYRVDKTDYRRFGNGLIHNSTDAYIFVPTPVTMRVEPTITKSADSTFTLFAGGVAFNTITLSIASHKFGLVEIKAVKSGYTPGHAAMLAAHSTDAAYIELSAEL